MLARDSRERKSTRKAKRRKREHSFLKLDLCPYVMPSGNPSFSKTLLEGFLFITIVLEL
jgi:hypothetical protein